MWKWFVKFFGPDPMDEVERRYVSHDYASNRLKAGGYQPRPGPKPKLPVTASTPRKRRKGK